MNNNAADNLTAPGLDREMGQDSVHAVTVLELINVSNYTYLRVKEGGNEYWLAAPSIETQAGEMLYYEGGMMMTAFESKELNRTFDRILFVGRVVKDRAALAPAKDSVALPPNHVPITQGAPVEAAPTGSAKDTVKQQVRVAPAPNGISIGTLLKNPGAYDGKTVILRGKITKYTAAVMGKNWVHIQDGTDFNGKFDMVITTLATLVSGETATFEGKITLNKDLGYGYFFEVLMEDAKVLK